MGILRRLREWREDKDGTLIGPDIQADSVNTDEATVKNQLINEGVISHENDLSEDNVAQGDTSTLSIDTSAGGGSELHGFARVMFVAHFSTQTQTSSAYILEMLGVDVDESGGEAPITTVYDGSTGDFSTSTSDFTVSRTDDRIINVEYTNNNSAGANNVYWYPLDSVNYVSASLL